jgi:hypothetical protein
MHMGYIKSNITKNIAPELFFPHEFQKNGEIDILQSKSCDNLADLFTKSLPTTTFQKMHLWHWYETTSKFAKVRERNLLGPNLVFIIR